MIDSEGAAPRPWNLPSPRQVLLAIAVFAFVAAIGGGVYQHYHRHDTICKDRKPPVAERPYGIAQTEYLCHDGTHVIKP